MMSRMRIPKLGGLLFVAAVACCPRLCYAQESEHKTEAQVAEMTVEERVREYCREFPHLLIQDDKYLDLLKKYLHKDGIAIIPPIVRVIKEFNPTTAAGRVPEKDVNSYAAEGLLWGLDLKVRVRGFKKGREAIEAVKELAQRMRKAGFESAPDEEEGYSRRNRYDGTLWSLEQLQGINFYDDAIRNSLESKFGIKLSDKELIGFCDNLISQDPYYSAWSETEWYTDHNSRK